MSEVKVVSGQRCSACGKAAFYWRDGFPPENGERVEASMAYMIPEALYQPEDLTEIRCQYCCESYTRCFFGTFYMRDFNYETGEEIGE